MAIDEHPWWKEAAIYQIYPASFKDSNGDGLGDLPGILSKLDYIKWLGVDAIWICPMYDSPQHDMGYDISNYEEVYPPYGTVKDMEDIIAGCHERGLRVLLDLVINHTSNEHAWFKESRASKTNPKRDWYIWRPAKYSPDGTRQPPNNWRSNFGGSAWEWDDATQEYYLHLFCPEQPDLNWDNPTTRAAIYESAVSFWLRKGVDGFRVDTVNMYSKPPSFPDAPITAPLSPHQPASSLYCNGPHIHTYISELHALLPPHTPTIGELPHTHDPSHILRYVSASARQLSMTFTFDIVDLGQGSPSRFDIPHTRNWSLPQLKDAVAATQAMVDGVGDGWATAMLENHDQARAISRWGCEAQRTRSGQMLAVLLGALSGTLFLYQGQEIGMVNAPGSWGVEEYRDVDSRNWIKEKGELGEGDRAALRELARDHARLPMQWDGGVNAGFTSAEEGGWMRVCDNYAEVNVERERGRGEEGVLGFWRRVVGLRKVYARSLVHGVFGVRDRGAEKTFVFEKRGVGEMAVVACNFSGEEVGVEMGVGEGAKLVLGNYGDEVEGRLRPWEGRIYVVKETEGM